MQGHGDASGVQREAEGGQGGDLVHKNGKYGLIYVPCPQGVWCFGRKKINFEFCQNKNWVRRPKYITHTSAICLQKENGLLNFTK